MQVLSVPDLFAIQVTLPVCNSMMTNLPSLVTVSLTHPPRNILIRCYIYVREQNFGRPSMFNQVVQAQVKALSGVLSGTPELQASQAEPLLNTNTGSIDATQVHLHAHAHHRFTGRSSGSVKWKLETLKHFFNRRTTGTQLCAPVCGLPRQPELGLALQKFSSEGFLLENLQSNFPSTPNRTRNPDQASEEVLVSVQFLTSI